MFEVAAAGGEDNLVGPHGGGVLAHDGAVHQRLILRGGKENECKLGDDDLFIYLEKTVKC